MRFKKKSGIALALPYKNDYAPMDKVVEPKDFALLEASTSATDTVVSDAPGVMIPSDGRLSLIHI